MKLNRREYEFEKVPEKELCPCCLWEYARESRTVMNLVDESNDRNKVLRSPIVAHVPILGVLVIEGLLIHLSKPWQALPDSTRALIIKHWPVKKSRLSVKDSLVLVAPNNQKRDAFTRGNWWHVQQLRERFLDFSQLPHTQDWVSPARLDVRGREIGVFTIDWTQKNEDIEAAFSAWLKRCNRPEEIPHRDDRGHNSNHYRVALRRLGIMRQIWADPAQQADAERNKEARRALKHFRYEFMSEVTDEMLIHQPTFLGT